MFPTMSIDWIWSFALNFSICYLVFNKDVRIILSAYIFQLMSIKMLTEKRWGKSNVKKGGYRVQFEKNTGECEYNKDVKIILSAHIL